MSSLIVSGLPRGQRIAALAITATVSAFLLGPLADGSPASESSLALALALPLGDVILLAMVIGLYSLNRRNLGAQWATLTVAVLASLIGGLLAVSEIVASDELTSSLPTALFCIGLFAYAVAAGQRAHGDDPGVGYGLAD